MNIINYARAIPYGMREQAIERLSFGLANEPKWGRKQKSQVALLLTYFKQGYYNDNIEFLEQMIKDWDIITSKDFVIFSDQAQEDFNEHPYSYWAKKIRSRNTYT